MKFVFKHEAAIWMVFSAINAVLGYLTGAYWISGLLTGMTFFWLLMWVVDLKEDSLASLNHAGYHVRDGKTYRLWEEQ